MTDHQNADSYYSDRIYRVVSNLIGSFILPPCELDHSPNQAQDI